MKRLLSWSAASLLVFVVAVGLAFRLSPWPSVAVITFMFSKGDQASEAALEKHVPPGIMARPDIAYGSATDEVLDVYSREGTAEPRPTIVWVHGGGFIAGSKSGIANYMRVLAGHVTRPKMSVAMGMVTGLAPKARLACSTIGCAKQAPSAGGSTMEVWGNGNQAGRPIVVNGMEALVVTDPFDSS